jgi:FtsP/CotA-like multicopper oxidase with cupredoxin domain
VPATIRYSITALLLIVCTACARHYSGRVVDAHGRAVPYARVEGSGMRGGMITGEGPFTIRTVADADGNFTLVTSDGLVILRRLRQIQSSMAAWIWLCQSRLL